MILTAAGEAALASGMIALGVEKTLAIGETGIEAVWVVRNASRSPATFQLGSEWNLYQFPGEFGFEEGRASLCGGRLSFRAEGASLRAFPIETLSQSERGYDIIHQGYCLLALWRVELPAGGGFEARIRLYE